MIQARSESAPNSGILTVAAAPAGDAADVPARLRSGVAAANLIAVADPGRLRALVAGLGLAPAGRVISWTRAASSDCVPELLAALRAGQDVLLVTDAPAGTDEVGRGLIAAAAAAGIAVTALPGPSPVTAALAVAGLPAERFTVEGAPPSRAEARERRFAELAPERRTLIFSESPSRLAQTLAELAGAFGAGRRAVVCRAFGAADQDVVRGTLGELADQAGGGAHGRGPGDVTVVVAGAPVPDAGAAAPDEPEALADAVAQVRELVRDGATTRDAVAAVASQAGLRRRALYNAASEGSQR
jgi:16S rRNA (cytidine1402-2'-O)-methyltransferase